MNLEIRDEELIAMIGELSSEGLISLHESPKPSSFSDYLTNITQSWWVYTLLVLALAETLLVEYQPSASFLIVCRLILGFALLGFIPGYSALKVVFPNGGLSLLERLILSIFLIILISILVGTLLGAVLAFEANTSVLVLTMFTFVITVAAGYRSFNVPKSIRSVNTSG